MTATTIKSDIANIWKDKGEVFCDITDADPPYATLMLTTEAHGTEELLFGLSAADINDLRGALLDAYLKLLDIESDNVIASEEASRENSPELTVEQRNR